MRSFLKTLLFLIAGTAFAQPYPSKPIRVIVPFSPGGPVDVVMRLLSPKMTEMLGQPLVIENKTGAGGNLGVQQAARAPADGYTVLATSSSFAVNPALTPDAGYNPEKDFIAVAVVASQPNFIVVNAAFPARTLAELLQMARTQKLAFASPSSGTTPHLTAENLFKVRAKVDITHVPFRGAGPAAAAVLGGEPPIGSMAGTAPMPRSEEHTSELQSRQYLVCRLLLRPPPRSTLFPYTTLFRSRRSSLSPRPRAAPRRISPPRTFSRCAPKWTSRTCRFAARAPRRPRCWAASRRSARWRAPRRCRDRKSTRLNSSHANISYAVFCFAPHRALPSFPTRRSSDLAEARFRLALERHHAASHRREPFQGARQSGHHARAVSRRGPRGGRGAGRRAADRLDGGHRADAEIGRAHV